MIEETYEILAKLKLRRMKEVKDMAPLLEKIQRTDVKEDEDLLTEGEKEALHNFNVVQNKVFLEG
jgi:hypothetical protein